MDMDDEAKKLQDLKAKIQRANDDIEAGKTADGEAFFRDLLGSEGISAGVNQVNAEPGNL